MDRDLLVDVKPVTKVNIPATLSMIPLGRKARFLCSEFAPIGSVQAAISRLKKKGESYVVEPIRNGEAYYVTRV